MDATLTIRRVPLAELQLDPANARSHPERNLDAIRASLARFGQAEPLVVQKGSQRVIGGNGRLVAMRALGWTEADVVELDLDDLQATALAIALNRTGELAEWDLPTLSRHLDTLNAADSLDGVGFDVAELDEIRDDMLAGLRDEGVEDMNSTPAADTTSRKGDVWILGQHRLECGDSASPDDLDRLVVSTPIDPRYADVIVERWQKLTRREALLEGKGRTFAWTRGERGADHEPAVEGGVAP